MSRRLINILILSFGLFWFNLLFWYETLGVNLLLFSAFLLSLAHYKEKPEKLNKEVYLGYLLSLISGVMVVWHNSGLSVFMHFISVFITIGFLKHKQFTTVFEAFIGFFINYISSPISWYRQMQERRKESKAMALTFSFVKLCVIPAIVFILFFVIYVNANPKFAALSSSFTEFIAQIFKDFSFTRVFFLLFGFTILSVAFVKTAIYLSPFASPNDELERKKGKTRLLDSASLYGELKNEYKVGILIFSILNVLLLVVNVIDIQWIWFGFEVPLEFNLKSFVHEGTLLLIFSILLSMGIFLYFFRGNLNFYSKNKWLKSLGVAWIAQNVILTISVFIRNYHYIDYHGLAGKRIGMVAFLLMTVFGLVSLIYKVNRLKTTAYLVRLNGWFIVITMTLMGCVNWDKKIVTYNLTHSKPGEIDVDYYLKLDETVSPILFKNMNIIEQQMEAHLARENKNTWLRYTDIDAFKQHLEYRTQLYLENREETTWASWNVADSKLKKQTMIVEEEVNFSEVK